MSKTSPPKRIVYRVRTTLIGKEIDPRAYEDWLRRHIDTLAEVENSRGDPIFGDITARKGRDANGNLIFVIDHETTNQNLAAFDGGLNAALDKNFRDNWEKFMPVSFKFERDTYDRSDAKDVAEIVKIETDQALPKFYSQSHGQPRV